MLNVSLGSDATIMPGDQLRLKEGTSLVYAADGSTFDGKLMPWINLSSGHFVLCALQLHAGMLYIDYSVLTPWTLMS